jgi:phosphate starvation-inducible protein PhoH
MARRRRSNDQATEFGESTRQRKTKKPIGFDSLINIEPLTENQKKLFDSYALQKHIVAYGCAGTGKTFISLYNALKDVLNEHSPVEKVYIVRSLVATREIGFLPGSHDDKADIYQIPYKEYGKVYVPDVF